MLKKSICVLFAVVLIFGFSAEVLALESSDISAVSAVLYCKETSDVIFEKDSDRSLSMASTTKIMTSVLALECNTPYREVEITDEMVNVEGTSSGLKAGDKIRLSDLIYCMLLESGNDAANSVAIAVGGSFEGFAEMMNRKASEIGMNNTSFVTPSGLDAREHYTTAHDMALLTAYALDNEEFVAVCSKGSYTVSFVDSDKQVSLYNHNRLLNEYEGCIGVKTGFTKKSGRCLVSAAERDGITLIAVTLNAGDDWNDHKKMLDYGFECMATAQADTDFSRYSIPVVGSEMGSVGVVSDACTVPYMKENGLDITREIYLEKFLYAPVSKGDTVGFARYYNNGKLIAEVKLVADSSADILIKDKFNFSDRFFGLFDRW